MARAKGTAVGNRLARGELIAPSFEWPSRMRREYRECGYAAAGQSAD